MSTHLSVARVLSESAAAIGLAPIVWVGLRRLRGSADDRAYWWLALAFAVSWIADLAALWLDPAVVSLAYPISQAGIIGAVFLVRRDAVAFLVVLLAAGVVGAVLHQTPDVVLRSVAMLGVVGIVIDRWALGAIRTALLVYFGVGWCCWIAYAIAPGWWTWSGYQAARLVGVTLLCSAMQHPPARLRLA